MHRQTEQREGRLLHVVPDAPPGVTDVVAVVAGEGNKALFASLGATQVVAGGQSMNPAASELVEAIERTQAPEAIVLPNNSNVVLAAEQARGLATKPVHVVRTTSIPAGLAALVAFDPNADAEANVGAMEETLASVATGAVTVASKDATLNGLAIKKGDFLGLAEGEPIASTGTFDEAADAVLATLLAEPRGIVTLLTGEEAPNLEAVLERLRSKHPDVEVEVHQGGQPHYQLLLGAE
jgi:hypothetical protein